MEGIEFLIIKNSKRNSTGEMSVSSIIVLFPVFIAAKTLTIMLSILLHLGSFAIGLIVLLMIFGIISKLFVQQWGQAAWIFVLTVVIIGIFFVAGILIGMLEVVDDCLGDFIWG